MTRAAEANDERSLQAISDGQYNIDAIVDYVKSSGKPLLLDNTDNAKGSFLLDTGIAARLREFRQFSLNGAAPEIAGSLLGSEKINFFGDQVFVKEPGTRERTAFHQDATYFEIEGEKCCVLWIPVDPVTLESGAILYVRGSHRDGKLYQPNVFFAQTPLPGAEGEPLPDIEGHMSDYDIIHFDVEPATSSFIIIQQFMAPVAITAAIRSDVPLHCVTAVMTFVSRRDLGRRANFTTRLVCRMAIL
jgi:hypothetical protein